MTSDAICSDLYADIKHYTKSYDYETAAFLYEILLSSTNVNDKDYYNYAKILYEDKQYRRAINFIYKEKLDEHYLTFRILLGRCYFAVKESIEALEILDINNSCEDDFTSEAVLFETTNGRLISQCYLLQGEIHESIENGDTAIDCYKSAVKADITCFKALKKLYDSNCMSPKESRDFLDNLNWNQCKCDDRKKLMQSLYYDLFKMTCQPDKEADYFYPNLPVNHPIFRDINCATRCLNNSFYKIAFERLKGVLETDQFNLNCIIPYSSVLKELKKSNKLYSYSTELMKNVPHRKESWFSLGCYNILIGQPDQAIRSFNRAIELDKHFGYAWLALGHLYSSQNLRDQALRAYVFANASMKGSHLPNLMIALEYSISHNSDLSNRFLTLTQEFGRWDPYFWHEKGFILYSNSQYNEALECFLKAKEMRKDDLAITRYWEPLLNNIGHCYYKLGEHKTALEYYDQARSRNPTNTLLICSIALTKARMGLLTEAQAELCTFIGRASDNVFIGTLIQSIATIRFKYEGYKFSSEISFDTPLSVSETNEPDDVAIIKFGSLYSGESMKVMVNDSKGMAIDFVEDSPINPTTLETVASTSQMDVN